MPSKRSKPQHKVTKRAKSTRSKTAPSKAQVPIMADASSPIPVYFWRETEPSTGYLSQWYPCAFTDDADPSIIYPTAEHYMMYQKALLFSDPAVASEILAASHPRAVKALGRKVANFSDAVWHAHREAIVRKGNLLKFTRPADEADGRWIVAPVPVPVRVEGEGEEEEGEEEEAEGEGVSMRELLLRTGEREIVEASPMDRIWGIGFGAAKAGSVGRQRWGLNLLGRALMAVRAELREAQEGAGGKGDGDDRAEEKREEGKGKEEKEKDGQE